MRTRQNRLWVLTALLILGAAIFVLGDSPTASAGTVVTAIDGATELELLQAGSISAQGYNCNQVCPFAGDCLENCSDWDPTCVCTMCPGGVKCIQQ